MYVLLSSIFLMLTLQHSALCKETEAADKAINKQSHLNSAQLANEALKAYQEGSSKHAEQLVLVERSLYKNPYRSSLYAFREELISKLPFSSFGTPLSLHILTAINPFVTFLIAAVLLLFAARFLGVWYNHHIHFTKPEAHLSFYALMSLLGSFVFLGLFLWHYDKVEQPWVCLTAPKSQVYSGPSEGASVLRSLPQGSCVPVESQKAGWVGFSSSKAHGWLNADHLKVVRGALKID